MEEKIVDLIHKRGLQKYIVYSTFYAKSLEKLSGIDPEAELGILDVHVSDCLYKIKGGCKAVAVHPFSVRSFMAKAIMKVSKKAFA